jgi:diguanylate cyclase (GGDEF)-like protein
VGPARGASAGARWVVGLPWGLYITALPVLALLVTRPSRYFPLFVLFFMAMQVLGIGLSMYAATRRSLPGRIRRTWLLVAVAWVPLIISGVGLGEAVEGGSNRSLIIIGGICRVIAVIISFAALQSYPQRPMSRGEGRRFALDMLTVVGGGSTVMWYFLLGPAITGTGVTDITLLTMGYAVCNLVTIFSLCAVILRGRAAAGQQPLTLLIAGLALYELGDLYLTYRAVHDVGSPPSGELGVCMVTAAFLMALSAAEQARKPALQIRAKTVSGPTVTRLPYLAVAVGVTLLLLAAAREGKLFPWAGLAAGVALMTAAVGIRQLLALRDLHALLMTDPLTGLANRVRLRNQLDEALERRDPDTSGRVALLLIDLDGFKAVNDTLGHEAGDALLIEFAERLRQALPRTALPARLGGDEFAVLLSPTADTADAVQVAERIIEATEAPVRVSEQSVAVRASIGVAVAADDTTAQQLLHEADLAMYTAKRRGGHDLELHAGQPQTLLPAA